MSYLNYCSLFSFSVAATRTAQHLLLIMLYCIITYCYIILTLYVCHLSVSLTPVCHLSLSPAGWVVGACYYYWVRHVMMCCRRKSLLISVGYRELYRGFCIYILFSINLFSFFFCPLSPFLLFSFSPLLDWTRSATGLDSNFYWIVVRNSTSYSYALSRRLFQQRIGHFYFLCENAQNWKNRQGYSSRFFNFRCFYYAP